MKVYQYGHIKPQYAFCSGCGAILEFVESDIHMSKKCLTRGPQHDGTDRYVMCPCCLKAVYEKYFRDSPEAC